MKTIFVLIDALKSTYLTPENMPFLYGFCQNNRYIKRVMPGPGFCERSEIITGLDAFDTGNFTAIGFDPQNGCYRDCCVRIFGIMELFSKRISRSLFRRYAYKKGIKMSSYNIPFSILKNFVLTEDGERKYIQYDSIFDILKKRGKSFSLSCFTSLSSTSPSFSEITEQILSEVNSNTYFIPAYIGIIDEKGHKYGSTLESIIPYLNEVDEKLRDIANIAIKNDYCICFLGDHGMIPVVRKVNILQKLQKTGLRLGVDYCMFLDSTIARFWFYNNYAENKIKEVLKSFFSNDGVIVSANNYLKYRIPLDVKSEGQTLYGDLLWFANRGVVISPDFFHTDISQEKGMHGYLDQNDGDGTGLFASASPLIMSEQIECISLKKICNELCNLLEIDYPNQNWKRLVER
ncbi:alkaline phosphatase family protein [bacterium]|nr:alkaline phosphatase family protein [bacterium]